MKKVIDACEWSLAVALVCGSGLILQAQQANAQQVQVEAPGTIIRVGPDKSEPGQQSPLRARARVIQRADQALLDQDAGAANPADDGEPSYWIGILGGDISPELRAHLGPIVDEEETGVIVREIVPDSPAAESGLKKHDILLRANGRPITGMITLVEEVRSVGPGKGRVTIDYIRGGERKTLWVAPVERPETPEAQLLGDPEREGARWLGVPGVGGAFDQSPFRLRMFGNGVTVDGPDVQVNAPGGVSVSVSSVNGKSRVIVKQGDQTWDIDPSDPEMLDQLPPDVRGMVDGVLSGAGPGVDIDIDGMLGDLGGLFNFRRNRDLRERRRDARERGGLLRGRREMRRQMDEMQRQLDAMRAQLGVAAGVDPALDEAPPYAPSEPIEVEIPGESQPADDNTAGEE